MYARNGDWTKCLSLAEKQSPKMLPHYLAPGWDGSSGYWAHEMGLKIGDTLW
jgi:hypothetical protein